MTSGPSFKPNVVFLDSTAQLSGGELALLTTLPALKDLVAVTVVLAEDGPLRDRLVAREIRTVVLPLDERVRDAGRASRSSRGLDPRSAVLLAPYIFRLRRLLRALNADIVHCNNLKSALYGGVAGRLAGIPVVWHVRDRIAPDYLPLSSVRLVRLASQLLPTAVVANSMATLDTLPSHRLSKVVASPVRQPGVARRRSGPAPFTVGTVGRLSGWKGQDLFLRAFAEAFCNTDVRARIIGSAMFSTDRDVEAGLRALSRELDIEDQVEFRGFREDIYGELSQLDLAVHCSTIPEPFGKVVVEAMVAGVPVIAAAEGGPVEIITHGENGLLVPPRNVTLLAQAMRRVRDEPALGERLQRGGRVRALDYSPEAGAQSLMALYEQVLPSPRSRWD